MTGLGTPNVGVMVAYLTKLLSTATRSPNVPDPVIAPITFPTSGPLGTVLRVIKSGLISPSALAMNGTTLLVSDYFNEFTTTYSSKGVQGSLTLDNLSAGSQGLAVDSQRGLVYQGLSDYTDVAVFNLTTGALLGFLPLEGFLVDVLPRGLAVEPATGDLYIATLLSSDLTVIFYEGGTFGQQGTFSNANFSLPTCVAFSADSGTLYVGDELAGRTGLGALIAINSAGLTEFVLDYTDDGMNLDYVTGLAVDNAGNIYIVDQNDGRIVVVNAAGTVIKSIFGSGAGNSPYNAFFSVDGFVLPFSVAVDPRGYYVYVSDGAAGNVVQLAGPVALPSTGATVGDPQFYGFRGQSYQVHGIDGEVYNIISDANVQINGRFAFLQQARQCVKKQDIRRTDADGTSSAAAAASVERRLAVPIQCWSHPGSYIGQLSVQTALGVRLVLQPGCSECGLRAGGRDSGRSRGGRHAASVSGCGRRRDLHVGRPHSHPPVVSPRAAARVGVRGAAVEQ